MSLTTGYPDYNNSKAENQGEIEMELTIAEKKVYVKEYAGQRVVTFADIDAVHRRSTGTASRNFRENRKRFIEGVDYIVLTGDTLKDYKQATNFVGRRINELHLITETGYLMLVKSFTDDLAWSVQRELVNHYFRNREVKAEKPKPKRAEVVDIPINPEFQAAFAEIKQLLAAVDVSVQCVNRYVSEKKALEYAQLSTDIAFRLAELVSDLTRMRYKVIPEPY